MRERDELNMMNDLYLFLEFFFLERLDGTFPREFLQPMIQDLVVNLKDNYEVSKRMDGDKTNKEDRIF